MLDKLGISTGTGDVAANKGSGSKASEPYADLSSIGQDSVSFGATTSGTSADDLMDTGKGGEGPVQEAIKKLKERFSTTASEE